MEELKLTLEEEVPAAPSLTLDAQEEKKEEVAPVKPVTVEDTPLTPEERQIVDDFAEKIDVTNTTQVMQYGSAAQKKIAGFSETALNNVRTKDLGEVGDAITGLITELKGFDATEEEKGFRGFFKRSSNKLAAMKAKYDKVEVNVDRISGVLDQHQITLMKDIAMLDKMYEMNLSYFKELSMYILAGKKKLNEVQTTVLPQLVEKAKRTGLPEDAQAANDLNSMCESFDKKLHDLELTRMVSIQMGPQIRLVQNNDKIMAEKIQSTLVNTIPLWKSQMVLALGMEHGRQATAAQNAVTEMTNELLKKNADALKMGTIATAKESERSIVDIETLQHTNQQLIATLDEVLAIQQEGAAKRRAAEAELGRIEGELKQKLMELHK